MKVELIDYTGIGMGDPWYAANLMIWTKRTRTEMSPGGLEEIAGWDTAKKIQELMYMAATVPSSWEFCDFTFLITGVTRAFTHQLVRTRFGVSFAQQALQILRVDQGPGWEYHVGTTIDGYEEAELIYNECMAKIAESYTDLCNLPGVHTEDARGLLPINFKTNIVMKINLRSLADMLRKRASPRNQGARPGSEGEWAVCHRELKLACYSVLPWTKLFLERNEDVVAAEMYKLLEKVEDKALRVDLTKRVDQLLTNIGGGTTGGDS